MFCQKCGYYLRDDASICTNCGSPTPNYSPEKAVNPMELFELQKTIENLKYCGIISIVLAIFVPIIGLVFGAIGFSKTKKMMVPNELQREFKDAKTYNKIGIIIPCCIIGLILLALIFFCVVSTFLLF